MGSLIKAAVHTERVIIHALVFFIVTDVKTEN